MCKIATSSLLCDHDKAPSLIANINSRQIFIARCHLGRKIVLHRMNKLLSTHLPPICMNHPVNAFVSTYLCRDFFFIFTKSFCLIFKLNCIVAAYFFKLTYSHFLKIICHENSFMFKSHFLPIMHRQLEKRCGATFSPHNNDPKWVNHYLRRQIKGSHED